MILQEASPDLQTKAEGAVTVTLSRTRKQHFPSDKNIRQIIL